MRYLPISILFLSIAGAVSVALTLPEPARAAPEIVPCRIPAPGYARFQALCELLRIEARQLPADWNEGKCGSEFLRRGKARFGVSREGARARRTVDKAEQNEANALEAMHPAGWTPTFCGDAILQAEFGEACDDGNDVDGDGCETNCKISP